MAAPAAVISPFDAGVPTAASAEVLGFTSMDLLLGDRRYDVTHRPLVMGILNRTRDSFYDGGHYVRLDRLLRRAGQLVETGADILEIGARPGGVGVADVDEATETDLVCESIESLRSRFDVPLAVDTWRANVARAAFSVGAVLGNDMSGFSDDGLPCRGGDGRRVCRDDAHPPVSADAGPRAALRRRGRRGRL